MFILCNKVIWSSLSLYSSWHVLSMGGLVLSIGGRVCILVYTDELKLLFCFHPIWIWTAMKPHEIQEKLGLTRIRDRVWYVQPACATTGDGLYEGLTWLTSNTSSWTRTATVQLLITRTSCANVREYHSLGEISKVGYREKDNGSCSFGYMEHVIILYIYVNKELSELENKL